MTPEQQQILKRKNLLERRMLVLRQELNNEHYYPELEAIQKDCPHTDDPKEQRCVVGMIATNWYCGYCGQRLRSEEIEYVNDPDS